jgi:hypothetical protein
LEGFAQKQKLSMTAKLSPLRKIASDALNLFDPAACRDLTYERDLQDITELLETLTRSNPDLAAQLDPTALARVLEQTQGGKTLEQALEEICVCA